MIFIKDAVIIFFLLFAYWHFGKASEIYTVECEVQDQIIVFSSGDTVKTVELRRSIVGIDYMIHIHDITSLSTVRDYIKLSDGQYSKIKTLKCRHLK